MTIKEYTQKSLIIKLTVFLPLAAVLAILIHASLGGFRSLADRIKITPVSQPPEGKFLFVESWVKIDGTGTLPFMFIDFPTYSFDTTTKVLNANYFRNNYPSEIFLGLFGNGQSRHGSAGGGAASLLMPLPTLPFSTTIYVSNGQVSEYSEEMVSLPVDLLAVSMDGKLKLKIADETMLLTVGKCWRRAVIVEAHNKKLDGVLQITSTLCNYGWLDLSQIAPR